MALIDDFKARFPEFNSTLVDENFSNVEEDYPLFYDKFYGESEKTDKVILMLLAHLFAVETDPSQGQYNQFSSNSVRSVSGSFSLPAITTEWRSFFNSKKYGQRFLLMIRKRQGVLFR